MRQKKLANPRNTKFKDLLKICEKSFGTYRVSGDHFIFETPWEGDPYINIQPDKRNSKMAKPYQVKQVVKAIRKLEDGTYAKD